MDPSDGAAREFEFTERDFQLVRRFAYDRIGISLKPGKQEMVYSRLARRLRTLGVATFAEYLRLLESSGSSEWQSFVSAITTNLTYFFREPHHFAALRTQLEELEASAPIRVWSAGTATGEEAYSLAIVLLEAFTQRRAPIEVLATDVDTAALREAEAGVYRLEQVKQVPPTRLKRFFLQGTGARRGLVRVKDEVRRLVSFRCANLVDSQRFEMRFHAIFCRNVMIYFDKDTQHRVLEKLHAQLLPGGTLYAGHAENFFHAKALFRPCGRTVYRRVED